MKIDFTNKTVVVTGGTRGVGAAIVQLFQECNAEIIATGTNLDNLKRLNEKSSDKRTKYTHLDFISDDSVQNFLGYIEKLGRIDVLINNAGVNKIDSIHEISENDWDWMNEVNLRGPFLITRSVSKIMKKQGYGKIVNIASVFSIVSRAKRAAYSTTKWGLVGFTKAIAHDLAPHNILVNAVSPGFVDTELTRRILGEKEIEKLVSSIPQKRLADAGEIAKAILFLTSDHNTYITGQNIIVDGGFTSA
ncbi:MAG: SDR family oxidoreductase [Candidatus Marinimicrobia bacterium]|jgi:3-oxoacyl-[acyl-carrier protein] reductase|nr:SDR family oxidoreductase [Candidatus Neomarinimicrobiota bacterium]|tara:strand:+ start:588 stop:1331 length:744 start_codon:yes stop_codon:yes gene_type:complete